MEEKGPRFRTMLLERRIPFRDKKKEFEDLINLRRSLVNELRIKLIKRSEKRELDDLNTKIADLEHTIKSISYEEN